MPTIQSLVVMLVLTGPTIGPLERAEMLAASCAFDDALEALKELPKGAQTLRDVLVLKARFLIQLDRGQEALVVLESIPASKDTPTESDRVLLLAFALSSAKQLAASEKRLREAEKLGADPVVVQGAVGMLRLQEGRLDDAETELRKALSLEPNLSGALFNLALVMARKGRHAEAAALVRQAWHVGYRNPKELREDPALAAVRQTPGLIDDLWVGAVPRCSTF